MYPWYLGTYMANYEDTIDISLRMDWFQQQPIVHGPWLERRWKVCFCLRKLLKMQTANELTLYIYLIKNNMFIIKIPNTGIFLKLKLVELWMQNNFVRIFWQFFEIGLLILYQTRGSIPRCSIYSHSNAKMKSYITIK